MRTHPGISVVSARRVVPMLTLAAVLAGPRATHAMVDRTVATLATCKGVGA